MLKEEQRFATSDILEGMTSISALLNSNGVNDRKIEKVLVDRSKRKSKAAQIGFLTAKSHECRFRGNRPSFCWQHTRRYFGALLPSNDPHTQT